MNLRHLRRWALRVAIGAGALAPGAALAQRDAACFDDLPVVDWDGTNLGLGAPGASAPEGTAAFRLCSDGAGYGAADALRTMHQNIAGDFTLTALLVDVDEGGLGGLEARGVARSPEGPRLRISVERDALGARLVAGVRTGEDESLTAPVPVALPVHLRLERVGGVLTASFSADGEGFAEALSVDTAATPLAATQLSVGAAQAAPDAAGPRTAGFARVELVDFTPPPDPACTQADVSPDGAVIALSGGRMSQVVGARVAGERAEIVAQSDGRLLLRAPRPEAVVASGPVVLETNDGEIIVGGRVAYAGRPFVRGDVNEDGAVDLKDLRQLRRWLRGDRGWIACEAAADVNADGAVDAADVARLRRFVKDGGAPPAAPFPAPGFGEGVARACGLGAPPMAEGLFDPRGQPLPAGATLREGDVIELRGRRLPNGADVAMYFGDVAMEQLPFGTKRSVVLRVGPVPTGGPKCPRLFEATDAEPAGETRFGLLREVRPDTNARHLCPTFEPSRDVAGAVRYDAERGTLRVSVPRSVEPGTTVQLDLLLARPASANGADRGARALRVTAQAPSGTGAGPTLLDRLAAETTRALDGDAPGDDCRPCEFLAQPDPQAGELLIRPCGGGLPPEPPPPPPPFETEVAPYVPPLVGGAGSVQLKKPSCDDPNISDTSRVHAWCVFEQSTRAGVQGLPQWESSIPQAVIHDGPAAPIGLPAPEDRPVVNKRTMFSTDAFSEALGGGYFSPCAQAARVAYCQGGQQDWMPPFSQQARIYKGFWRPFGKLPASVDPDDVYSYQPPDDERQYLVGLHISSGKLQISNYWSWATFWIPKGNDTHTKDGTPIGQVYLPACSTGSFADQPQQVQGVWRNYMMCVNGENGGTHCGNPWGPADECAQDSCRDCHVRFAIDFPGVTPTGELSTAWMLSMTQPGPVKACYDEIVAGIQNGQEPYVHLAPAECVD